MANQGKSADNEVKFRKWLHVQSGGLPDQLKEYPYQKQYENHINGLNYFKNQVWVVIALCFTLFGAVMWLFQTFQKEPIINFTNLRFYLSLSIIIIGIVTIRLIRGYYVKMKRFRLFIKVVSEELGYIDIDDFYNRDDSFIKIYKSIRALLGKIGIFFVELFYSILIILAAFILIYYIIY